jgi:hypothetical protein
VDDVRYLLRLTRTPHRYPIRHIRDLFRRALIQDLRLNHQGDTAFTQIPSIPSSARNRCHIVYRGLENTKNQRSMNEMRYQVTSCVPFSVLTAQPAQWVTLQSKDAGEDAGETANIATQLSRRFGRVGRGRHGRICSSRRSHSRGRPVGRSKSVRPSRSPDLIIKEVKVYVTDLGNYHSLNGETGELFSVVTNSGLAGRHG